MTPRLAWVTLLQASLGAALGEDIKTHLEHHTDPLKKTVVLHLQQPLPKGCWNALQTLVHGYAGVNDCTITKVKRRNDRQYGLDMSIKRLRGPEMKVNPFDVEPVDPKAKRREEFRRRLRDKCRTTLEED